MLRRAFIFLFYCFFALIVIGVLLVFLFPRDKFSSWAADRIEKELPGYSITIKDIRYVHPLKLRFYQVVFTNDAEKFQIPIDTLLVSFEPKYPITRVDVSAVLFGGDLESEVRFDQRDRIECNNLQLSTMHLADIELLQRRIERPVQGTLSFSGKALISRKEAANLRFSGKLQIDNFRTELRRPIFSNSEISFASVSASAVLGDRILDLSEGKASGPLLSGDFTGRVAWEQPWQKSRIDIEGGLVPQPKLLEQHPEAKQVAAQLFQKYRSESIPYVVDGSIKEPNFRFGKRNESEGNQVN